MTTQELIEALRAQADFIDADTYDECWEVKETPRGKTLRAAADRLSEMEAEIKRLRAVVQRVSEIPSPRKRPEDDIDALYQNEEHFAAVIDAARAALEHQQKGEGL